MGSVYVERIFQSNIWRRWVVEARGGHHQGGLTVQGSLKGLLGAGECHSKTPEPCWCQKWSEITFLNENKIYLRFLAFKTPLDERFDDQVPPANRFSPTMLFQSMKAFKVKIGLWINLTKTSRYATPIVFEIWRFLPGISIRSWWRSRGVNMSSYPAR